MNSPFSNFFSALSNLKSVISIVFKRLVHLRGVSLSSTIGIISVLSMIICVPIFTNAVLSQVLQQSLTDKAKSNGRALFSIHAYYRDEMSFSPLSVDNMQYIAQWISSQLTSTMGIKVDDVWTEMLTEAYSWEPVKYQSADPPFQNIFLSLATDNLAPTKTKIVEGSWPSGDYASNPTGPIPVAVEEEYADNNFLNVGDILRSTNAKNQLSIQIVGIFRPIDPTDVSWFYSPKTTYEKEVWVPLSYFQTYLPKVIERPASYTAWYAVVNDQSLRFQNSLQISKDMTCFDAGLHLLLNQSKIDYSPAVELQAYEDRMTAMVTLFYVAGAPLILLALVFISLTATVSLQQQDQEIATMRGRGITFSHLIGLNLLESLVLIVVSIPFSLVLGWLLANLMGQTQLFLQFTRQSTLAFSLADINLEWILVISAVILAARLIPLMSLRRTSIINLKQQRSRSTSRPFWERIFLDFILLVPAVYAYLIMSGKVQPVQFLSNLNMSGSSGQSDPLMFLASSLFAVSACMLALRAFPLVMRLAAAISTRFKRVGTYLAVQEIARRPQEHISIMLLIMVSLTLAIFSASIARTLDQWIYDFTILPVGADLAIQEYEVPIATNPSNDAAATPPPQSGTPQGVQALISLESHLQIPGVQSATYVGKYDGTCIYGSDHHTCTLMGIDRLTFPGTAYFRNDFASQSLGALMNALAANPNGVLVPQSLLDNSGLQIGDRINLSAPVGVIDQGFNQDMVIVGAFKYFPTIYPDQTETVVMNLGTLFGGPEAATGYDVWVNVKNKADYQTTLSQIKSLAFQDQLLVNVKQNALDQIHTLLDRPEWVGLFGILSVGFLLTGLMACIGFVLDTFASLRKHYIQLGILQAIGLSTRQLVSYLVLERVALMAVALGCGTGIGLLTSILFVPILQISTAPGIPIPPFQVLIGWSQSIALIMIFGIVLLATIVGTVIYLLRIKIFQAVKMGETI